MAYRGSSVAMGVDPLQPIKNSVTMETQDHRSGTVNGAAAFATRAQARLLDALGWQVAASPRREVEYHEHLQCCFVLRDGQREEAVFGYANLTSPLDMNGPVLKKALSRAERFLSHLGEDRGVLIQNIPQFAFGHRRPDRIAVFGGWRFQAGIWKPFFFGPDGLAGIAAQEFLFAQGTAPHHIADICGHSAKSVMPWIAGVVQAIETVDRREAVDDEAGLSVDDLQIVSNASGWSVARMCLRSERASARHTLPHKHIGSAADDEAWIYEADEFRFHQYGADRG